MPLFKMSFALSTPPPISAKNPLRLACCQTAQMGSVSPDLCGLVIKTNAAVVAEQWTQLSLSVPPPSTSSSGPLHFLLPPCTSFSEEIDSRCSG